MARLGAHAVLVGAAPADQDDAYARGLKDLARSQGLDARVTFMGPRTPSQVRDELRRADVAVNLSPPGLFDKAALEAMMVGTPTIVASQAFDDLLGAHASQLRVRSPESDADLAEVLAGLLTLPAAVRAGMSADIRPRAVAAHGRDGMMDRLVALLRRAVS
jgi:D-inositol-3-phosphate glycosyltransferase